MTLGKTDMARSVVDEREHDRSVNRLPKGPKPSRSPQRA